MGFKSGLLAGHFVTWVLFDLNQSLLTWAVWIEALSRWNTRTAWKFSIANGSKCLSRVLVYLLAFCFPEVNDSVETPHSVNVPQTSPAPTPFFLLDKTCSSLPRSCQYQKKTPLRPSKFHFFSSEIPHVRTDDDFTHGVFEQNWA